MKTPDTGLPPPAPKEDHLQHDLPAQNETGENHTHIPMPAIKAIADRDPAKDRTIDAPSAPDTAGTKPISTDPSIDAAKAKKDAERNPALTGSTFQEAKTSAKTNLAEGAHRPDAPEANFDAPPPAKKDIAPGEATPAPTPVSKDAAPSTPAKTANGGSASAASTPASTPAKSAHTRESTSGSDVKKRKSGFFHKVSLIFHLGAMAMADDDPVQERLFAQGQGEEVIRAHRRSSHFVRFPDPWSIPHIPSIHLRNIWPLRPLHRCPSSLVVLLNSFLDLY